MAVKVAKVIRLIYKILFSLLTVTVAALFIYVVIDTYVSGGGGNPFTREEGIKRLGEISIPFWVWLGMILFGLILWEVLPPEGKKKYGQDVRYSLYRLKKKLPVKAEGDLLQDAAEVKRLERILKIVWAVIAVICLIFAAVGLAYLLDFDNFSGTTAEEINREMVTAVLKVFPFVICAFALCIGGVIYQSKNSRQQLPHIKKLVAEGKKEDLSYNFVQRAYYKAVTAGGNVVALWAVRVVVLAVAIMFIIFGVSNGGAADVLSKAAAICRECIGLA